MIPYWLRFFFSCPSVFMQKMWKSLQNTLEKRQAKTLLQNLVLYIPVTIFKNSEYESKTQVYCRNSTTSIKTPFFVSSTLSDNIYSLHDKTSTFKEGTVVLFFFTNNKYRLRIQALWTKLNSQVLQLLENKNAWRRKCLHWQHRKRILNLTNAVYICTSWMKTRITESDCQKKKNMSTL